MNLRWTGDSVQNFKADKVRTFTGDIGVICGVDGNLEHLPSNSQAL